MPIYDEIWAGPGRNVKRINGQPQITSKWYVTIHNTSNNATARDEASYAKVRTDGVGAHYFIDNIEVLQSTDTDWCVGHVGSTEGNTRGISYEITGVNGWTREQWMANVAWDKLAAVIARDCAKYGIPVRLLTVDEMQTFNSSTKGFVTHNLCRLAWGDTTHTDPGPNFPMDHLLALVGQLNGDDDMADYGDLKAPTNLAPYNYNFPDTMLADIFAALVIGDTGWGTATGHGADSWALYKRLAAIEEKVANPEIDYDLLASKLAAIVPKPPTAEEIAKAVLAEQVRELTD